MTIYNQEDLEIFELREMLDGLLAALVTVGDHDALTQLFAEPAGCWLPLDEFIETNDALRAQLDALNERAEGETLIAWMDYLDADETAQLCTIMLFNEGLVMSAVAIYNRAYLLKDNQA
jgi:hypothetical protein